MSKGRVKRTFARALALVEIEHRTPNHASKKKLSECIAIIVDGDRVEITGSIYMNVGHLNPDSQNQECLNFQSINAAI